MFNRAQVPFVSLIKMRNNANHREGAEGAREVAKSLALEDSLKNDHIDGISLNIPYWAAGSQYQRGELVTDPANGRHYIVCRNVPENELRPPHCEGMLKLYRPVPKRMVDGSYLFILGQNVFTGDICRDAQGAAWKAKKDLLPCVRPPREGEEWEAVD